jgi:hypothetical protein
MSVQPKAGEMLVGAYLKHIKNCDVVTYNATAPQQGDQTEIDVIGINLETTPNAYVCEIVTHLGGMGYGTYQESRERLEEKFVNARGVMLDEYNSVDSFQLQLWSPRVPEGLAESLSEMTNEFEQETGDGIELITNDHYSKKVHQLRNHASTTKANGNELAFRFLQILEHLSSTDAETIT